MRSALAHEAKVELFVQKVTLLSLRSQRSRTGKFGNQQLDPIGTSKGFAVLRNRLRICEQRSRQNGSAVLGQAIGFKIHL